MSLKPDPTSYATPAEATAGPPGKLAYASTLDTDDGHRQRRPRPDPGTFGQVVGRLDEPNAGDELHAFRWNACSSAPCPWAPCPRRAGRPTARAACRCPTTTRSRSRARGRTTAGRRSSPTTWWRLGDNAIRTSEWGTPNLVENGLVGELLINLGRVWAGALVVAGVFYAPVVIARATPLILVLLIAGCGGGGGDDGGGGGGTTTTAKTPREQFAGTCGSCHTLSDAGTQGTFGPNLDDLQPDRRQVLDAIANGPGGMPGGLLRGAEAEAVADYVAGAAG